MYTTYYMLTGNNNASDVEPSFEVAAFEQGAVSDPRDCADRVPFNILTEFGDERSRQARSTYARLSAIARRNILEAEEAEESRRAVAITRELDTIMPTGVVPNQERLVGDALEAADHALAEERVAQIAIEKSGDKLWE